MQGKSFWCPWYVCFLLERTLKTFENLRANFLFCIKICKCWPKRKKMTLELKGAQDPLPTTVPMGVRGTLKKTHRSATSVTQPISHSRPSFSPSVTHLSHSVPSATLPLPIPTSKPKLGKRGSENHLSSTRGRGSWGPGVQKSFGLGRKRRPGWRWARPRVELGAKKGEIAKKN